MLSDAQRARLLSRVRPGGAGPASIPRRPAGMEVLPCSFGQEQLWVIDRLAPGSSVYNIAGALRLVGPLDVPAWERALGGVLARHEVLRTRLVERDGRPVQVIDDPAPVKLPVEDLRGEPWQGVAAEEADRPFDLAAGPLLRTRLLRVAGAEHVLVMCFHHTVFDGWSFGVFLRELAALYEGEATGRPAALPELPIQYADYAVWERGHLTGQTLDELVAYWREALAGVATVDLPTDRPRPAVQSFAGAIERAHLDAELLAGLRELARANGTTLFVVLLTAITTLIHRHTGQGDITIGTASANRTRPELAPLVGYLVNTLPIRTDASGDPTFTDLLARVAATTTAAYAHQDLPFPQLVQHLRVDRDPSRTPVFQIGLTTAEAPAASIDAAGVEIITEGVDILPAKIDLNFFIGTSPAGIQVDLSYATALFDRGRMAAMVRHLEVLLRGIVADPARPLSRLPMLTEAELRRELVEWNDTAVDYPVMCLHELFERQVRATPEATAAVLGEQEVSYAELNAEANRVAHHLRGLGVTAETLVGIAMPPGPRRLAALLGVIKAGGGYVPLDPALPAGRLTYMIDDAGLTLVLTDATTTPTLAPALPPAAAVLDIDAERAAIDARPGHDPAPVATPGNAVYVIYTSGSTGRPKGVVVEHAAAVNYIQGMTAHWPLRPGHRVLQFASLSFDVSVMDMFVALCSGATAVFADRTTLHTPHLLADHIRRHEVGFACLPPAVLSLLTGQHLPSLEVLISAGEALTADLVTPWLAAGRRFCNGYGPTEATMGVTLHEITPATPLPPPIGAPMPNYTAYVLDARLNVLPQGAVGELHIGGKGLARGYHGQPELTRRKFIPNPLPGTPGDRLYKTGDLARRNPDGTIQFVGRTDNQIKIRGLRVELGEIEAALNGHPAVAQSHISVTTGADGHKQLIAYARTGAGGATPEQLRSHLTRTLPGYMIPTHLITLEEFPLTPNGKIDTRALPAPDSTPRTAHTPPRTLLQTLIADLYSTTLANARIGIHDNFFDLGGNSLQAMHLTTQLTNTLNTPTDITAVFQAPTPAQLALLLCERYGLEDAELDPEEREAFAVADDAPLPPVPGD